MYIYQTQENPSPIERNLDMERKLQENSNQFQANMMNLIVRESVRRMTLEDEGGKL